MANAFDQFDTQPSASSNPFDQFGYDDKPWYEKAYDMASRGVRRALNLPLTEPVTWSDLKDNFDQLSGDSLEPFHQASEAIHGHEAAESPLISANSIANALKLGGDELHESPTFKNIRESLSDKLSQVTSPSNLESIPAFTNPFVSGVNAVSGGVESFDEIKKALEAYGRGDSPEAAREGVGGLIDGVTTGFMAKAAMHGGGLAERLKGEDVPTKVGAPTPPIGQPAAEPAKPVDISTPQIAIGLNVSDQRSALSPEYALGSVVHNAGDVVSDYKIIGADSPEPTMIVDLKRPLTQEEGVQISHDTGQTAIAQHSGNGNGEMFLTDPETAKANGWDQFSPDYFPAIDANGNETTVGELLKKQSQNELRQTSIPRPETGEAPDHNGVSSNGSQSPFERSDAAATSQPSGVAGKNGESLKNGGSSSSPGVVAGASRGVGVAAKYAEGEQPGSVIPGEGRAWQDSLQQGRDFINTGGDPRLPIRRANASGMVGAKDVGIVRAEYERLAAEKRAAREAADAAPNNPVLQQRAVAAEDSQASWRREMQPVLTKASDSLRAIQAEGTPSDVSTFSGLHDMVVDAYGGDRELAPKERTQLRKLADNVSESTTEAAKAGASDAEETIRRAGKRKIMSIDQLKESLSDVLKDRFSDCLTDSSKEVGGTIAAGLV